MTTLLSAKELIQQTGISDRQLDYWVTFGVIPEAHGNMNPGSGINREFSPEVVPRVRTLVYVQNAFENSLSTNILRGIYKNWEKNKLKLNSKTWIVWT